MAVGSQEHRPGEVCTMNTITQTTTPLSIVPRPQRLVNAINALSTLIQMLFTYFCYRMGQKPKLFQLFVNLRVEGLIPIESLFKLSDEQLYYACMHNSVAHEAVPEEFIQYYNSIVNQIRKARRPSCAFFCDSEAPWPIPAHMTPQYNLAVSVCPPRSPPSPSTIRPNREQLEINKFIQDLLELEEEPQKKPDPFKFRPNSKSEVVRSRESSNTRSVDAIQLEEEYTRSQEKRNIKFSSKLIKKILRQNVREKRLTCLRQAQRQHKLTRWEGQSYSSPIVSHNNRRLEKFLENKNVVHANSLVKKFLVKCCANKNDSVFEFLNKTCRLDEFTSMALAPIIKGLKKLMINKFTITIVICVLAYALAKYVPGSTALVAPIIAILLGYLVANFTKQMLDALTSLYNKFVEIWAKAKEDIIHVTDVEVHSKDFKYVTLDLIEELLALNFHTSMWRSRAVVLCMQRQPVKNDSAYCLLIPSVLRDFLLRIEATKMSMPHLEELLIKVKQEETKANSFFTNVAVCVTDQIRDVLHSIGLISSTFKLPQAVYFYHSTKKFIKQVHEIITDIYPTIYEFVTGKDYVPPEIAKYVKIFGEISQKVHLTLKESRQTNIARENAQFRLRVILEYEQLLDAQMKLLSLKAPQIYMTPINNLIREMSTLANECYSRAKGEAQRDEPVLILVRGPPGVGKTTLDHALALIIAQRLQISIDTRTDFFQREAGAEHWDGYENQMFVSFDDAFQLTDPEKQANTILEVIKCKNSAPYKLTMAALEAKRNSFFNSKFIFISTNVPNVVCDQVADIGAFFRRIDFDVVVRALPPPRADGTPSFEYEITVNGKELDPKLSVPLLADSIVAIYKERSLQDHNIAREIAKYAKSVEPCKTEQLIKPRNSVRDLAGVDHGKYRTNGLLQVVKTLTTKTYEQAKTTTTQVYSAAQTAIVPTFSKAYHYFGGYAKAFTALKGVEKLSEKIRQSGADYLRWLAGFAIGYTVTLLLIEGVKTLTTKLHSNSRKVKDQLTGDRVARVVETRSTITAQLEAAQAAADANYVKKLHKANSSSTRWKEAMVAYIKTQGWQNQPWVAQSLAAIKFLEDFDCTEQEMNDLRALKNNIVELYTYYEYGSEVHKMFGRGLILSYDSIITASHQLPSKCKIIRQEINLSGKIIEIAISEIQRFEKADTCVIKTSAYLPCRDLSYMFHPKSEVAASDCPIYLLRNFDDVLTLCPVSDFNVVDREITYKSDCDEIVQCGEIFESKIAVCPGDSGCFYVAREHGRFHILGMHVASSYHAATGRLIYREMLSKHIKPPKVSKTPYDNIVRAVDATSKSFDERVVCNSNCLPLGIAEPRTMLSNRSKIQRSVLYHDTMLPKADERPADLRRTYDIEDPLLLANSKFRLRSEPDIDEELKEEIVLALLDEHPNTEEKIFLTNVEAIAGTTDMPRLNMATATGYPESTEGKTPKNKLSEEDWVEMTKDTDGLLEDLYNGHPPQSIFQTSFKDELREEIKVKKPRVINCASVRLTMLFRRVLGPWMKMVHKYHNSLRTKVGINAHGDDWKILFDKLVRISADNIVELDYSGYEYNHPQFAYLIASRFIYRLYVRSGFSERDARAAELLVKSCAGGYVIQNEVLIFVWMLLSGLPITAELNSLLNSIYQMVAYKKLTGDSLLEMRSRVASAFYGDDLIHSVSPTLADKFNSHTISKFCDEFLQMKVTPASNKGGEIPKFISILDCSFLCRKFAPRENRVDAPLKLMSCINSLQYYVPVAHMTQRELLTAKCRNFVDELTHYPREVFDYWLDILSKLKDKHKLSFICYDYPTALARRVQLKEMQ
jgi:hypothetical protein